MFQLVNVHYLQGSASAAVVAVRPGHRFHPEGLLNLLAEDVIQDVATDDIELNPPEERLEGTVLIPMLQQWGCTVARQVACVLPGKQKAQRGRIDLLVYAQPAAPPITLTESKRHIRSDSELPQTVTQAAAYTRSLTLSSFVIAAPRGMWLYRHDGERSICV